MISATGVFTSLITVITRLDRVIHVDDFSSDELMRIESQREPRRAAE